MSKIKCNLHLWPEGEQFTREVIMPTGAGLPEEGVEPVGYEDFPVMVTFRVPSFDVLVETWRNTDPYKSFGLFRQFIVSWDQEDELTDKMLAGYLYAYPGAEENMFRVFCEYVKEAILANQKSFTQISEAIH
ncbi:hypothetical protein [Citrobacter freundii]|uniref:hypothetical protein n=1 Tax=Citrobacter freundii TaxID=546 RepID=UPI001FFE09FB|nr:hypothetical protein [Citrobacter freundii]